MWLLSDVKCVLFQVDGEAKVSIPLADVKKVSTSLDGHFLFVRANVSESLTGNTMSAEAKVKMHDKGVVLEFPTSNPTTFKPGLRYTAYVSVLTVCVSFLTAYVSVLKVCVSFITTYVSVITAYVLSQCCHIFCVVTTYVSVVTAFVLSQLM